MVDLKNRRRIFIFFAAFLFFISFEASAQKSERLGFLMPEGVTKISFPMQVINNLVIVQVKLNNTIPLKFILDTGVRTSILTEKTFSDLLNVQYTRVVNIPGAGGKHLVTAYIASDVSLDISGVKGKGHALLVLEEDLLQLKNFLGENVQGILGYEVFSRFVVEIDYGKERITLHEPSEFNYDKIFRKKKWNEIPITIEDTKPYFSSKIITLDNDTVDVKLMIDTGASNPLLLDEKTSEKIYVPEKHLKSNLGRGLGGNITGSISRVKMLELGKYEFEDVITTFPDSTSYLQEFKRVKRNGTIGGGLLNRFKVILDFGNGYMYLKKNNKFHDPFEYNISGLVIKAEGLYLNEFKVTKVRANSAAEEAGVMEGDMIIRVNNRLTKDLSLDEINGMLNDKVNRSVRIELKREGKIISKRFKLKRLI